MTIDEKVNILNNNEELLLSIPGTIVKHSIDVVNLSYLMGKKMSLTEEGMGNLLLGAAFHDIGKQFVPVEILNKPGKLTDEEFAIIKTHSQLGYDFMKKTSSLPKQALEIILDHHEKANGTGYPNGKKSSEISVMSKIVAICDVYNSLVSERVYKKAMSSEQALGIIEKSRGTHFDSSIVEIFKSLQMDSD